MYTKTSYTTAFIFAYAEMHNVSLCLQVSYGEMVGCDNQDVSTLPSGTCPQ